MSTYEFEKAAKNAIVKAVHEKYGEELSIGDVSVVWMVHLLGDKKGIFMDNGQNQRLYEVTYNKVQNEMYLDIYDKQENRLIKATEFDFEA